MFGKRIDRSVDLGTCAAGTDHISALWIMNKLLWAFTGTCISCFLSQAVHQSQKHLLFILYYTNIYTIWHQTPYFGVIIKFSFKKKQHNEYFNILVFTVPFDIFNASLLNGEKKKKKKNYPKFLNSSYIFGHVLYIVMVYIWPKYPPIFAICIYAVSWKRI